MRPKKSLGRLFGFFSILVLLSVLAAGCEREKEDFVKPPTPVEIETIAPVPLAGSNRYSASLTPKERVNIAFKVEGYVTEIMRLPGPDGAMRILQMGDKVKKGDALARLRDNDYLAALRKAEAAQREELASLREAKVNFARYTKLFADNAVAKSEYDKAREKIEYFQASSERTAHEIEEARIRLGDTVITAPLDAVVFNRMIEVGTLVSPGNTAFTLADLDAVKAVFGLPDYLLSRIKTGDELPIRIEAMGNAVVNGMVTAVSPSADAKSRVFDVEVSIPNPDGALRDGMIASVSLEGADAGTPPLAVPIRSIVRNPADPNGFMVYTLESSGGQEIAKGAPVEIADVYGDKVLIKKGVEPGARVVTTGATIVSDGSIVTVIQN